MLGEDSAESLRLYNLQIFICKSTHNFYKHYIHASIFNII